MDRPTLFEGKLQEDDTYGLQVSLHKENYKTRHGKPTLEVVRSELEDVANLNLGKTIILCSFVLVSIL